MSNGNFKRIDNAVPSPEQFLEMEDKTIPGDVILKGGSITLNHGRKAVRLKVTNTGDRPIQVLQTYLL